MLGLPTATGWIRIEFLSFLPLETACLVVARIDRVEGRKCWLSAEMTNNNGAIVAKCTALMIVLKAFQLEQRGQKQELLTKISGYVKSKL